MTTPIVYMPFLFHIPAADIHTLELGVTTAEDDLWIVKIALYDYKVYRSEWMADDTLGKYCLVPDVDLTREQHVFYSEQEALRFIKDWWSKAG